MTAEQLDMDDLDAEDLKALAEVKKKGYYHGRPKSEPVPIPERLPECIIGAPQVDANGTGKRTNHDAFQKKWDQFDTKEPEAEVVASGGGTHSGSSYTQAPGRTAAPAVVADEDVVAQLTAMGFGVDESRKAAVATKNDVNAAVEYIFQASQVPAVSRSAATGTSLPVQADAEKLALMLEMGFSERQSRDALVACSNDVDRAGQHVATTGSAARLQGARDALLDLEREVDSFENQQRYGTRGADQTAPPDPKRLRILEDALTQASCRLDAIDVDDGVHASRAERRLELDRCNALDARIAGLKLREAHDDTCAPASVPVAAAAEAAVGAAGDNSTAATASTAMQRIAEAERLRLAGNDAFKAEDFQTAMRHYRGALELDAENVAILSNLAAAALKLGEFEEALHAAIAANKATCGFSAKALFRQGQALEGLRRLPEACDAYQAALQIEPSNQSIRERLRECQGAGVSEPRPET